MPNFLFINCINQTKFIIRFVGTPLPQPPPTISNSGSFPMETSSRISPATMPLSMLWPAMLTVSWFLEVLVLYGKVFVHIDKKECMNVIYHILFFEDYSTVFCVLHHFTVGFWNYTAITHGYSKTLSGFNTCKIVTIYEFKNNEIYFSFVMNIVQNRHRWFT